MARYKTTQRCDTITYGGKTSILVTSPLESHPDRQVLERLDAIVWRTPRMRRGYIGTWVVEDGKVLLTGLEIRSGRRGRYTRRKPKLQPVPLERIFPEATGPIQATWFDGVLVLGETRGLLKRLGLRTTFVLEAILAVNAGVVESSLALQTMPDVSAIGRSLGAAVKGLLARVAGLLPSRLAKLRPRWRGVSGRGGRGPG